MKRSMWLVVGVLLALMTALVGGAVAEAAAPQAVATGDVFPIGPLDGDKYGPAADMDAAGNMIVAWNDLVQRLDPDGNPIGEPIQVRDDLDRAGSIDDVSADGAGNFVAVWGVYYEVRGRCFAADGTPQGPSFALDDAGRGGDSPAVEMAPDGSFVAVWSEQYNDYSTGMDYQISARRFWPDCTPVGGAFTINNTDTGEEREPDIAMDGAGNFIVAWSGSDGNGSGVFARRFDAVAAPRGGQFRVNQSRPFDQFGPSVGMDAAGNAVIAFETYLKVSGGEYNGDVLVRRYNAAGNPMGNEFSPHNPSLQAQYLPRVVVAPSGDFAIMWTVSHNYDRDLWLQNYFASGAAVGPMYPVSVGSEDEYLGVLATGGGEGFLAAWPIPKALGQTQLYGRLFEFDEPAVNQVFQPTNDAYVMEARPNNTYGSQKVLQVMDAARDVNTCVKFNVSSLSGTVERATLRLWVTDPGPDGGAVHAVGPYYRGTTTLWLETGLTWNNAPDIAGEPLDVVGAAMKGRWVELDVTAAVVAAQGDNGRVGLAIVNDSKNVVKYSSKEGAKAPELVVYMK